MFMFFCITTDSDWTHHQPFAVSIQSMTNRIDRVNEITQKKKKKNLNKICKLLS